MPAVRSATQHDLEALLPLWHTLEATQRAMRPLRLEIDPDAHFEAEFRATVDAPGHCWIVATDDDDTPIAMAYLHQDTPSRMSSEPVLELSRVAVAPHARGRGIGRMLIAEAERIAHERGIRYLSAKIFSENRDALEFWQRHQFEPYVEIRLRRLDPASEV